ncbi:hypothetical protein FRC98_17815 [Lujinxingia vulgaris]|uniref:RCC1-like domain-containing protein n=1 Tax=Lujinxingia vulgaris TaxID=2600176 RepID=A0A5C6X5R5_9DELT|nr:RCC1 domain-containing protein [Lujinxingia vulgaris]TXD34977.1 hypothetical protein FRC98_17815 [Lujinxingia vulgaris]
MRIGRRWGLVLAVMLLVGVGTGCGDDDPPEDRDADVEDGGGEPDGDEPDADAGPDVPDGEEPDIDVPDDGEPPGDLRLEVDSVDSPVTFEGAEAEVTLTFSCEPAGCVTTCQLNELAAELCTSPYLVEVDAGEHTVVIRASYEGEEVQETVSFRTVQVPALEVSAPAEGDVYRAALGEVVATCTDREDCTITCEVCADGSCEALVGCEEGAALVLEQPEVELVVRACVEDDGEESCNEDRRTYTLVEPQWSALSLGETHGCAILADATLWCWGNNTDAQLGSLEPERSLVPLLVEGSWAQVSAGTAHSCGIRTDGTLWCWGQQQYGRLGNGEVDVDAVFEPVQVGEFDDWDEVSAGDSLTCGRRGAEAFCWGYNPAGRLGVGSTAGTVPTPTPVSGERAWRQISTGAEHICGLTEADEAFCWGRGGDGRLGYGGTENLSEPTAVGEVEDATMVRLAAGFQHTCADMATSRGARVFCWGPASTGRLGTGDDSTTLILEPKEVGTDVELSGVSSGNIHSCAIAPDDVAWCWGYNNHGQIGVEQTGNELVPIEVDTTETFAQIEAGKIHTCGITTAGALLCWGENGDSELGREIEGTETSEPGPVSWPYGLEAL